MHIGCFDKKIDQSPRSGQFYTTDRSHVPDLSVIRRLRCIPILVWISTFITVYGGKVYICNLSELLDQLLCRERYYCATPSCLLYVNPVGNLVPIVIQLQRIHVGKTFPNTYSNKMELLLTML